MMKTLENVSQKTIESVFDIDKAHETHFEVGQELFEYTKVSKVTPTEIELSNDTASGVVITVDEMPVIKDIFSNGLNLRTDEISFYPQQDISFYGNTLYSSNISLSSHGCKNLKIKDCNFEGIGRYSVFRAVCEGTYEFINCNVVVDEFMWYPGIKLKNSKIKCRDLELNQGSDIYNQCKKCLRDKDYDRLVRLLDIPFKNIEFEKLIICALMFDRRNTRWLK